MPASIAAVWLERLSQCPLPRVRPGTLPDTVNAAVQQLTTALDGDHPDTAAVRQVAVELVESGADDPAVLARSLPILRALAEAAGHGAADRVDAITGAFGEGFCAAVVEAAEERSEGLEAAFRTASLAIAIGDPDGRIHEVNPAFERLTGYRAADLRGTLGHLLVPAEEQEEVQQQIRAAHQTGLYTSVGPMPQADGTVIWSAWTAVPTVSKSGKHHYMIGFGEDITERHNATEALKWQALHDPLTSLANRRHLLEHLEETAAAAGSLDPAAVCAVDLDGFKPVNDSHGHLIGDQLLIRVAQRMQEAVADTGCFLARVGGDEFVAVVSPPTGVARVQHILSGLQAALGEPFRIADLVIDITASVGAVLGPLRGRDPTALLDAADQALYEAKTHGTNQLVLRRFTADGDLSTGPWLR
ncbi:sensor domain-containing diguanylate cyclase [Nocardia stercoris]|uniref:Sensor domain-containing diguanylate cyclase n=1 Tax=Nocardia stercoris TaxID=2483361 RepID=A0A3M2L9I5_9NOCA|nr:sensor domain-containing diguanylate cyclase [Nocardia stercoris]RMI34261.1 sensor domain-containing diguanylate cyclase [Nocardia stercoris]